MFRSKPDRTGLDRASPEKFWIPLVFLQEAVVYSVYQLC